MRCSLITTIVLCRLLYRNTTWNGDLFVTEECLRAKITARTLTYVDADYIEKETLGEVLERFPPDKQALRMNTLWQAVSTGLLYVSYTGGTFPNGTRWIWADFDEPPGSCWCSSC